MQWQRTIKVLGKGNKERMIPVNKELAAAIEEYASAKSGLSSRLRIRSSCW
jgi:site-specific recombinase XerD